MIWLVGSRPAAVPVSHASITVVKNGISNDRQKQSIDAEVSIL